MRRRQRSDDPGPATHTNGDGVERLIDVLPWPAFIVAAAGCVTHLNPAAEASAVRHSPGRDNHLSALFPDYFAALKRDPPWLAPRQVRVTRSTASRPVHELLWVRKLGVRRLIIAADETTLRELESAQAQNARLASLGFLLASVSHEINNPLSTINSIVQILQSKQAASREVRVKGIAQIAQSTNRLLLLTRKLTSFARVDDVAATRYAIDAVIDEASLQLKYDSLGETVAFAHQRSDTAIVLGQPGQMQQALFNLFLNAAQAMKGRGTISVATRIASPSTLTVTVADSGPGIAADHLDDIFKPFFTTKGGEGLGLGLAICNEIVHEHAGTIAVTNGPEGGAQFRITLPLAAGGGDKTR